MRMIHKQNNVFYTLLFLLYKKFHILIKNCYKIVIKEFNHPKIVWKVFWVFCFGNFQFLEGKQVSCLCNALKNSISTELAFENSNQILLP